MASEPAGSQDGAPGEAADEASIEAPLQSTAADTRGTPDQPTRQISEDRSLGASPIWLRNMGDVSGIDWTPPC